jgi:hypothetical protein
MSKHESQTRWEVITQEDPETGDLYLPIPPEMLQKLGWNEGDTLQWSLGENGHWIIRKESK